MHSKTPSPIPPRSIGSACSPTCGSWGWCCELSLRLPLEILVGSVASGDGSAEVGRTALLSDSFRQETLSKSPWSSMLVTTKVKDDQVQGDIDTRNRKHGGLATVQQRLILVFNCRRPYSREIQRLTWSQCEVEAIDAELPHRAWPWQHQHGLKPAASGRGLARVRRLRKLVVFP